MTAGRNCCSTARTSSTRPASPPPKTYDDLLKAAQTLNAEDRDDSGITLATAPGDSFTQQTFEDLALANGCQLVDGDR